MFYVLQNFQVAVSLNYEFKSQHCCNKVFYFETSTLLLLKFMYLYKVLPLNFSVL